MAGRGYLPQTLAWRWEDMCGPPGLNVWDTSTHDLGLCFQQLCLQIPTLFALSVASAFYFGAHIRHVMRDPRHLHVLNCRIVAVVLLATIPILQICADISESESKVWPITVFLCATQTIAWLNHAGYVSGLKARLGLSARGPVLICFLWTISCVLSFISLRSHVLILRNTLQPSNGFRFSYYSAIGIVILQLSYAITLIPSQGRTTYRTQSPQVNVQNGEQQPLLADNTHIYDRFLDENDSHYLGVAMEYCNWLSKLVFYWVNPLMSKGVEGKLTNPDDLHDLPVELSCNSVSVKLEKALRGDADEIQKEILRSRAGIGYGSTSQSPETTREPEPKARKNVSLIRALHACFGVQFYSVGILKLIADCSGFAGPLLLYRLVSFIENKSEDIRMGYLYAGGLCVATLIGAFCNAHFNFLMGIVNLKIRAAIVTKVYRKTLTVHGTVLSTSFNTGEIVNFMSTDTDRIVNSCPSFHAFWSIPFQIAVSLFLLYQQVGVAFVAGLMFSIALIPINKLISNKIGYLSTKLMERKDERVKIMTEILRGMRTIKIHVWESHFIRLVMRLRDGELRYLKGRKYLDALCVYFWATTPVLISILTFATYVLMGNKLTAATVFTSMSLLNMLVGPLNSFPWVLNGLTEAWVSIKRLQKLLDLKDFDRETYYNNANLADYENADIYIKSGCFDWGGAADSREDAPSVKLRLQKLSSERFLDSERSLMEASVITDRKFSFVLRNININVRKGSFVGIMGQVGSGKSSLLAAIAAEINKQQGEIGVSNLDLGFGFVTQQPWLQRGTIRDNILFGKPYSEQRYKKALDDCCLSDDLHLLPAGDLTGVGEGGVTLSGGQKVRVALARAVYQDKPIYLLDDVISAVDANVAKHIFQFCILGSLKRKTRILCTHHTQYLIHADHVIVMHDGAIVKQGKPCDVLQDYEDCSIPSDSEDSNRFHDSEPTEFEKSENILTYQCTDDTDSVLDAETQRKGNVEFGIYASYWKAIGHLLAFAILLSLLMMQSSRNMTDWWLSYWVSADSDDNSPGKTTVQRVLFMALPDNTTNVGFYMGVYGGLVAINSVFTLFRAFLFAYGGVSAAAKVHKSLLRSVIKAKVSFFDVTPIGRILNRFSSDTYTIDDSLPFIVNILLAQVFGLIGSVIVTIYGLPWLCLVLLPIFPVYHWLQNHYRLTSRELKRLSSVTLSPIYSHFNETLQGLATIRAMRATGRFKRDNEEHVDANMRAQFAANAVSQWLSLRLQFIGVAMVTGVGVIAVLQHQFDVADPGLIGLAISYALSVTNLLNGVVNAFTETEREMIAVERVQQYVEEIESEPTNFALDPPYAWPSQGVVTFSDVVLKHREHLAPSLKGVNFETRPAEKVGIVGRTGAGKSSLIAALFRLAELYAGSVSIDTVNVAHISLHALRSRMWVIPQEPFLYSASVRDNLDPLGEFKDPDLWAALNRVELSVVVRRMGGMYSVLGPGGCNLSVGQRQLFCLARAILHNAKVLCIDEATANVDQETDHQIQQTLRTAFRRSTVLTIAHRIQTVMNCDRVLVMSDGQVVELDHPASLMDNPNSVFYQLVHRDHF